MDPIGRDLGLRRVTKVTRWSLAGAVVLSGAFSALVAHARPGHAKSTVTAGPSPATTVAPAPGDTVQPPALAPAPGTGGGLVTSGAS